ncbi:topless-related protein 4-like [Rosa chinensis]|uniref:topless-related protein 4-like n=1 Tax=Rosa chinensis TaxID=74649 RepID=UPI001AD8D331|nr:topless-related protein 4-like [Rosa chinensis]
MVWSLDGWERQAAKFLNNSRTRLSKPLAQTHGKFQKDQIHILVTHYSQLAYLKHQSCSALSRMVYPAAVVAHPSEPNQFAIGLSDGGVVVLEPLESTEQWGSMPLVESAGPSTSPSSHCD